MRQVETEPKPGQTKAPCIHTSTPITTQQATQVSRRQAQAHYVKPPTGRQAREKGDRLKAHSIYQPKAIPSQVEGDRLKAHYVYQPKGMQAKGEGDKPRHTMSITSKARSQLTKAVKDGAQQRQQQDQEEETYSNNTKSLNQPVDHLRSRNTAPTHREGGYNKVQIQQYIHSILIEKRNNHKHGKDKKTSHCDQAPKNE